MPNPALRELIAAVGPLRVGTRNQKHCMIEIKRELYLATSQFARSLPPAEAGAWVRLAGEMERYETPCFAPDASPHDLKAAYDTLEPNRQIDGLNEQLKRASDPGNRRRICAQIIEVFKRGNILSRTQVDQSWERSSRVEKAVMARDVVQAVVVVLSAFLELGDREEALRLFDHLRKVEIALETPGLDLSGYAEVLRKFLHSRLSECGLFARSDAMD